MSDHASPPNGKATWSLGLTTLMASLTVLAAIYATAIRPVEIRLEDQRQKMDSMENRLSVLDRQSTVTQEKLKEIDTQINWSTDIENIHKRHVIQLMAIVWKKQFGEELPLPASLSDGPSKSKP